MSLVEFRELFTKFIISIGLFQHFSGPKKFSVVEISYFCKEFASKYIHHMKERKEHLYREIVNILFKIKTVSFILKKMRLYHW